MSPFDLLICSTGEPRSDGLVVSVSSSGFRHLRSSDGKKVYDSFRICVTGGRDYADADTVEDALDYACGMVVKNRDVEPLICLAHGGASGADTLCRDWANRRLGALNVRQFNAYWDANGPGAGAIRNVTMLDEFKPHVLIVFPGGEGTADCVKKARARGIPVRYGVELAEKARGEE